MAIKFGTDGWRAIVGEDFTPANVTQVIEAFADLYPTLPHTGNAVVIGYDRRNQSPETAQLVAQLLSRRGIPILLATDYCPTPAVSWMVVHTKAPAGIMITASHNPPQWNGIKFKESYGGAASGEFIAPIEARIVERAAQGLVSPPATTPAPMTSFDARQDYLQSLTALVDLEAIRAARWNVLFDPMYGAGAEYLQQLVPCTQMHGERDLKFGGIHPEPIIPYVNEAIATMQSGQFDVCVITDGDADRIGAIDETGRYVTAHEIFALLLLHGMTHRGWKGNVVKSITTTQMIDRICRAHQAELTVTPVGFKHISPALNAPNMLAGGEESGGIGFPRHLCERDGLLCSLLLLDLMTTTKKRLGELVRELQQQYGPCEYRRVDLQLTSDAMATARNKLAGDLPTVLCGRPVVQLNRIDGYHFLRDDDSWLLIRTSGTEPLLRTYAEATTTADVDALLAAAQHIIS